MSKNNKSVSVFVSSTCYDLGQMRSDLRSFIEGLGYRAILSDVSSFPVDPTRNNVDNCLVAIEEHASLFVLVVGGRYGSTMPSGTSITNMEYNRALSMGIPRFVFVQKSVLHMMPIWRNNKTADFTGICDSPKLFEFVETLHDKSNQWVFPFETANDIIEALKHQWAYLFDALLVIKRKLDGTPFSKRITELDGEVYRLAVDKPAHWEYSLFACLLRGQVQSAQHLKWDAQYGIVTSSVIQCNDIQSLLDLLSSKMTDLTRISESIVKLLNHGFVAACGPPGVIGDAEHIVYVTSRLGELYRSCLQWGIDFVRIEAPVECATLVSITSGFNRDLVTTVERIADDFANHLADALARLQAGEDNVSINLQFSIGSPPADAFIRELNRVAANYGIVR